MPFGFLALLLWKLKALLLPLLKFGKFLPALLKTGGSMFISVWVYAMAWGWKFAVGFVLLLFVHECGHLLAARRFGLPVSAPMFIPFVGALILLREAPRQAWVEAWIGIGGPILGSLGALGCHVVYLVTGEPLWAGLAFTGYMLNLFNLAPVGFLDGGRIVTAISPWLWLVGAAVLAGLLWVRFNLLVLIILLLSLPRLWSLFRRRSEEEERFFEVRPGQRVAMAGLYFGLIGALVLAMSLTQVTPPAKSTPAREAGVVKASGEPGAVPPR
jgi:Zn-dependent protease